MTPPNPLSAGAPPQVFIGKERLSPSSASFTAENAGAENSPFDPDVPRRSRAAGRVAIRRWRGRLVYVDDRLTLRMLQRLLADEDSRGAVLKDPELALLTASIDAAEISPSLNTSLAARCLLYMSDVEDGLPYYNAISELRAGQPVRVLGVVSSVLRRESGRLLRTVLPDGAKGATLRISPDQDAEWNAAQLRGQGVLGAGFLRDIRYNHVAAAAVMLLEEQ